MAESWFSRVFGEPEAPTHAEIQKQFTLIPDHESCLDGAELLRAPNNELFPIGSFDTVSVASLLRETANLVASDETESVLKFSHCAIGDVLELHAAFPRACFQVASQFNALEFPSDTTVPERGITEYAYDPTQGPACSLAAPAATLYRNYFVPMPSGRRGQTAAEQINALEPLLSRLKSGTQDVLVKNGYTTASSVAGLARVAREIAELTDRDGLVGACHVSVHRSVAVSFQSRWQRLPADTDTRVTQVFCSALSIAYSGISASEWEPLARVVLDGAYEATLLQAAKDKACGVGSGVVFLTFIGGGVFGNPLEWIASSIARAIRRCRHLPLDVRICHYQAIRPDLQRMIDNAIS